MLLKINIMNTENIFFKGVTALMITLFLRLPLAEINSHTYTVGVSNTHELTLCANDYYYSITPTITEIKDSNLK